MGVQRFDGEEYMVYIVLNHFDILCSNKAACIIPVTFPAVTKKILYKGKIFTDIFMFV
jgi:hypothetical protein